MGSAATASLLLLLAAVPAVFAVTFQVGDTAGWALGVNYTTWVTGKTSRVGDTLEFTYDLTHSVSVVDKAGFDDCVSSGATGSFSGGETKINLTTVGTMHFLCPTPGHCLGGMKLAVPVLPAAAVPPPQSSPKSPSPSPKSPSPSLKSPPLSPLSPRKPMSQTPAASSPAATPESSPSLTPTLSPSSQSQNAASKQVMSHGMFGIMTVLLYSLLS